jgi:hypothetical protein
MLRIFYTISLKLPNEVIYETVMSIALFSTENVSIFLFQPKTMEKETES